MLQGVVALVAVLAAGGRELPTKPTRYLVLWGGGHRLAQVLERYGVRAEVHAYQTTVNGRKYERFKLIVRDVRITGRLARLAGDRARLKALMRRFKDVVLGVLAALRRMAGWRKLLELVPATLLMRWLGIRPFSLPTYRRWRNRAIARHLKPNWRGWLFWRLRLGKGLLWSWPWDR